MSESTSSLAGRIFISYRREETGYAAGWLYDRLAARFGGGQVFKDVDSIQLGDDFVDVITSAVGSCDVLLALIGDRWSTVTDEDGKHRLDDPDDFVRLEIEAALTRDVRVIPILVDGARMPAATELPASLGTLVRRQSLDLDPTSFEFDTNRLLKVLDSTLAEVQTARRTTVADVEPAPGTTPMTTTPAEAGPGSGSAEPSQDPALTGEPAPAAMSHRDRPEAGERCAVDVEADSSPGGPGTEGAGSPVKAGCDGSADPDPDPGPASAGVVVIGVVPGAGSTSAT
ncbi:MAG: TIR domain-containing protein, partial [Acidimicrobiales bacterium]